MKWLWLVSAASAQLLPAGDPKLASSCLDKCKADTDKLNSTPAQVDMHCKLFTAEEDLVACRAGYTTGELATCVHLCVDLKVTKDPEGQRRLPKVSGLHTYFLNMARATACDEENEPGTDEHFACHSGFSISSAYFTSRDYVARVEKRLLLSEQKAAVAHRQRSLEVAAEKLEAQRLAKIEADAQAISKAKADAEAAETAKAQKLINDAKAKKAKKKAQKMAKALAKVKEAEARVAKLEAQKLMAEAKAAQERADKAKEKSEKEKAFKEKATKDSTERMHKSQEQHSKDAEEQEAKVVAKRKEEKRQKREEKEATAEGGVDDPMAKKRAALIKMAQDAARANPETAQAEEAQARQLASEAAAKKASEDAAAAGQDASAGGSVTVAAEEAEEARLTAQLKALEDKQDELNRKLLDAKAAADAPPVAPAALAEPVNPATEAAEPAAAAKNPAAEPAATAAPAKPAAAPPATPHPDTIIVPVVPDVVERRLDTDGVGYTYAEFEEYYGKDTSATWAQSKVAKTPVQEAHSKAAAAGTEPCNELCDELQTKDFRVELSACRGRTKMLEKACTNGFTVGLAMGCAHVCQHGNGGDGGDVDLPAIESDLVLKAARDAGCAGGGEGQGKHSCLGGFTLGVTAYIGALNPKVRAATAREAVKAKAAKANDPMLQKIQVHEERAADEVAANKRRELEAAAARGSLTPAQKAELAKMKDGVEDEMAQMEKGRKAAESKAAQKKKEADARKAEAQATMEKKTKDAEKTPEQKAADAKTRAVKQAEAESTAAAEKVMKQDQKEQAAKDAKAAAAKKAQEDGRHKEQLDKDSVKRMQEQEAAAVLKLEADAQAETVVKLQAKLAQQKTAREAAQAASNAEGNAEEKAQKAYEEEELAAEAREAEKEKMEEEKGEKSREKARKVGLPLQSTAMLATLRVVHPPTRPLNPPAQCRRRMRIRRRSFERWPKKRRSWRRSVLQPLTGKMRTLMNSELSSLLLRVRNSALGGVLWSSFHNSQSTVQAYC